MPTNTNTPNELDVVTLSDELVSKELMKLVKSRLDSTKVDISIEYATKGAFCHYYLLQINA